jgi:uncharacterized protein (TIGR00730 family)
MEPLPVPPTPPLSDKEAGQVVPPKDFREEISWRIFRIMAEFIEGFEFLAGLKKSVTIFGSTRDESVIAQQWYGEARKLGAMLATEGFVVVTGGGPGIMQAGNQGATEAGGVSVGLNIQLPREQRINPYVNLGKGFHYFFSRKLMMTYVYFPGGYGTLDEFFEIVTLIQTRKIATHIPVILIGHEFWDPLHAWMKTVLLEQHGSIDAEDLTLFTIVDSAEEAMGIIRESPPREIF